MTTNSMSVGVVIPAYNRRDVLARTLASLETQTISADLLTVVVADDGSVEDIQGLVTSWDPPFTKIYVRQEHNGFGAGRARNLGAEQLDVDVLILLDSDGVVHPDFVECHCRWHATTPNSVVIGGRVHVDEVGGRDEDSAEPTADRSDFRSTLSRRTSGYTNTDEGYRSFVSSNVSLPLSLFNAVGGFDARFRWWSSEDTELGWRLWQAGASFVDDPTNEILHQLDSDTAGGTEGRQEARELNRGLLSSLVPQNFYRRGLLDPMPEIPKVSVLVHDVPSGAPREIWKDLESQTLPDFEVIFVAEGSDHDPFAGSAEGDPRCLFIADLDQAVVQAKGEYLVFLNGHSAPSPTMLQNIVKRLNQRPASAALTFGVEVLGVGVFGRPEDLSQLEEDWAVDKPMALAVRKRWMTKGRLGGSDLAELFSRIKTGNPIHTRQSLVALPSIKRSGRPESFSYGRSAAKRLWEEAQLGPAQAFRAGLRMAKDTIRPVKTTGPEPVTVTQSRPGIRYIGWVGKDNLGDEAMLDGAEQLISWADVAARGEARNLLLLGGGTLINRNQYLGWLQERDSPRLERAVLGTGVASADFWGSTEDPDEWARWLDTCAYVGVRGPKSREALESWGVKTDIEVCGDLALALEPPQVEPIEGRVLISPAWTGGELWGGSDQNVYKALARAAAAWIDEGREVVLMSCHPSDDRPILMIRELLGEKPTEYVPGYVDVGRSFEEIAAASLVVGERLHACVLAAGAGRPFIGIEYRPKVSDFASSVGMKAHVTRSDELNDGFLVDQARSLTGPQPAMVEQVARYRERLAKAARVIKTAIEQ